MSEQEYVSIDYTNYRGERRARLIRPLSLYFGTTDWHPTPQWLLHAVDCEKGEVRDFAMSSIHSWGAGHE